MISAYDGHAPVVDGLAFVARDATVCGDVQIGAGARIMHGARVIAEAGGSIRIGRNVIVMENAVVRATARHACSIGDHCLVGPGAHVVGATIGEEVFIATGASVFHGASIGAGAEVRINGIVHLRTRLEAGATVPIGWVAVGDPAVMLSPDRHEEIWAIQKPLDFPGFVYGLDRQRPDLMRALTRDLSAALGVHGSERPAGEAGDAGAC
ncbi:MAG: gamma carbonic anhydrase family protein [Hyphomicrobiales bacterium]